MTTLVALLNALVARVPTLDWLQASSFVSDALRPAGDLLFRVRPTLEWIDALPIVGQVLVRPLIDIYVLVGMELGLLGAVLTALVMVGSGAVHALVESRVNDITEFLDTLQLFVLLVRGS